jgi:hypothetical protein
MRPGSLRPKAPNLLAKQLDLHGLLVDLLIKAPVFGLLGRRAFLETVGSTGQKGISPL